MDSILITCPVCGTKNRIRESHFGETGKCGSCHKALPPVYAAPVELTDAGFDDFIARHPGPVLAEFWAPW